MRIVTSFCRNKPFGFCNYESDKIGMVICLFLIIKVSGTKNGTNPEVSHCSAVGPSD